MNIPRVLICSIILLTCSPLIAQDYEIRMTRPTMVGDKYEVIVFGSSSVQTTVTTHRRVINDNKSIWSASFEGTITTLKVDDQVIVEKGVLKK